MGDPISPSPRNPSLSAFPVALPPLIISLSVTRLSDPIRPALSIPSKACSGDYERVSNSLPDCLNHERFGLKSGSAAFRGRDSWSGAYADDFEMVPGRGNCGFLD